MDGDNAAVVDPQREVGGAGHTEAGAGAEVEAGAGAEVEVEPEARAEAGAEAGVLMVLGMRPKGGMKGVEMEREGLRNTVGILQQGGAAEEVNVGFFIRMNVIMMVGDILIEVQLKAGVVGMKGGAFLGMPMMRS